MDHRALMIVVAAAAAGACGGGAPAPATLPPEPPRAVRVAVVERTDGAGFEAVPGVVASRRRATLAARAPGTVVALPFREGERVAAGAVVVRLDAVALRSAEAGAAAEVAAAESDFARTRRLLERDAATRREMEQATARAAGARAGLAGARDSLSHAVLRAPFAGVVAARPVNVGDVVGPGAPLLEIEGDGGLEVRATVDGAAAAKLAPGQEIAVDVDGQASPVRATIRSIAPAADAATHRVEVRADLEAAPGLRSGLFARLRVPRAGAPALVIPSAAVLHRGGLTGIFVIEEGRARLRWIAVGAATGDRTELRAGAAKGERVVLDPGDLADGALVEAQP
jgi:RND family efflux transporter MFP subunit